MSIICYKTASMATAWHVIVLLLSLPYLKDPEYTFEDDADLLGYQSDRCYIRLVPRIRVETPEAIRARVEISPLSAE